MKFKEILELLEEKGINAIKANIASEVETQLEATISDEEFESICEEIEEIIMDTFSHVDVWELVDEELTRRKLKNLESRYNATFTSVWDGGFKVSSRCFVDEEKMMIRAMSESDCSIEIEETLNCLDEEFVVLDDGRRYEVYELNNLNKEDKNIIKY